MACGFVVGTADIVERWNHPDPCRLLVRRMVCRRGSLSARSSRDADPEESAGCFYRWEGWHGLRGRQRRIFGGGKSCQDRSPFPCDRIWSFGDAAVIRTTLCLPGRSVEAALGDAAAGRLDDSPSFRAA